MVSLPPYRFTLETRVKSFRDALDADLHRGPTQRFRKVLDELESFINSLEREIDSPKADYLEAIQKCRESPDDASDRDIALGIAAATKATNTDILGAFYQLSGRTIESFNQYFTPPNVAESACFIGQTNQHLFEPPEATLENAQGQSGLNMFGDGKGSTQTIAQPADDYTLAFDPACGSGRLLTAASRVTENTVCLGWELNRETARMAAITLALSNTEGWIISGDSLSMEATTGWRVAPNSPTPLEQFNPNSEAFPSACVEHAAGSECSDTAPSLVPPAEQSSELSPTDKVSIALQRGPDLTVGNPPFDTYSLDAETVHGPTSPQRFDIAQKEPSGADGDIKSSQKLEWLFTNHALRLTPSWGAVEFIVPTSMLSNPSEETEREWLIDNAYYEAAIELPPETFAPETTTATSIISLQPKSPDDVDLRSEYKIHMAIAKNVGHNESGCKGNYLHNEDGNTVSYPVTDLPDHYKLDRWAGKQSIKLPNDDLITIRENHRDFRRSEDDSASEPPNETTSEATSAQSD